jgi:hypothetical protein
MLMHLRHGVTVEQAVTALHEAIRDTVHVTSSVVQAEQKRQAYLNWADATLQRVRTVFSDSQLESSLLGRGYWHICGLTLPPKAGRAAASHRKHF